MLLLLISGLCFVLTLGFGSVLIIFLVPVLLFKFPTLVATAFDFIISLAHFYGEILFFMIGSFLDITHAVINLCFNIAPFLNYACAQIYNVVTDICDNVRYQIGPQVWNFAQQQTEIFLFVWGLVVTSVYAFFNTLTSQNVREERLAARVGGNNYDDDDDDDFRREFVAEPDFERHQHQRNIRNRNRLYPDLNDLYTFEEQGQNEDNGYDERNCVVCFERDRNAALFPCGHTQTCLQCSRHIMRRNARCPICQRRITDIRQVYV